MWPQTGSSSQRLRKAREWAEAVEARLSALEAQLDHLDPDVDLEHDEGPTDDAQESDDEGDEDDVQEGDEDGEGEDEGE